MREVIILQYPPWPPARKAYASESNISILYQIGIANARKKCMRLKINYRWNLTGNLMRLWVEIKNRGLKISVSGRVKMSQNWRFKNAVYDEGGTGGAGTVFSSSDTSW